MQSNYPFDRRPALWLYHEMSHHEWKRPEHYNLCFDTIRKHCSKSFRIVQLTRYNIYTYLPQLRQDIWYTCSVRQRIDYIKWHLLASYGGMFLAPDVVILKNPIVFVDKLKRHDCVLFGKEIDIRALPQNASMPTGMTPLNIPNKTLTAEENKK